ncbi:MAG: YbaN family protein [bacterium]|nr:YbaN family protein [bacterium]
MFGFFKRNIVRFFLFTLSIFFILVGFLGIFLPVIPGMVFFAVGIGLFVRAFPFLSIIFKVPGIDEKINQRIGLKVKLYIVFSLWLSYLVSQIVIFYFRYNLSFDSFLASLANNYMGLLAFILPPFLLLLISFYVLWIKNLAQVLGYSNKKR